MTESRRGRGTARRLLASVLASQWAILPEWLNGFAGLARRMEEDGAWTAERLRSEIQGALAGLMEDRPAGFQSVGTQVGEPLPGADPGRAVPPTRRGGVAIVPVIGPLYHYADDFTDVCGCSAYDRIARDIGLVRAAREAGIVHAALFEVDSPGGEVGGCAEAAGLIAHLAAEMPVRVFASDLMCSAGLWVGVSAGRGNVIIAPTAIVGSLGVVATYRAGGKSTGVVEIVSSQSPNKRLDPSSEKGRARIQATVDALAEEFVDAVAGYRGVTAATVLSDFGQGDVFVGRRAVEAGLADRVGSFESVLAELASLAPSGGTSPGAAGESLIIHPEAIMPPTTAPAAADPQPAVLTAEQLRQQHPTAVAEIETAARTAERARIQGILQVPTTDAERLAVMPLLDQPNAGAGDAALAVLAAARTAGTTAGTQAAAYHAALRADENAFVAPAANTGADADPEAAAIARIVGAGRAPSRN